MLIDDVTIKVASGRGGRGKKAFNKNLMSLGPAGGNGGDGGSVYAEGIANLGALNQFRYKKELAAENGGHGKEQFRDGKNGKDLIMRIPVGTVIHNLTIGKDSEILKIGERALIAKGGRGGKGNFKFRSSRDTSPTRVQEGLTGEEFVLRLELKLIADVGLIGLPNVGKSSLLNELTKAKSKVANYNFTTLEPNLGVYYDLILADIPGLIEGAAGGKGLGIKFLRHIERTQTLFHLISAESRSPARDYKIIRSELKAHNPELLKKKEYVILSKSDEAGGKRLKKQLAAVRKISKNAFALSVLDDKSIAKTEKILQMLMGKKNK